MARFSQGTLGVLLVCLLLAGQTIAQRIDVNRLFGAGMHAYFEGDIEGAMAKFDAAIKSGSNDPRVHYFRGLCQHQMGDEQAAGDSFAQGWLWESRRKNFASINNSLERVQGPIRLEIEAYRSGQRVAGVVDAEPELIQVSGQTPFASQISEEGRPLSSPNLPDPTQTSDPTLPFGNASGKLSAPAAGNGRLVLDGQPDEVDVPDLGDPFGGAGAVEGGAGVADPATSDDPFGGGTASNSGGREPESADDPFGQPQPSKRETTPASDDDPFGGSPAQTPSANEFLDG